MIIYFCTRCFVRILFYSFFFSFIFVLGSCYSKNVSSIQIDDFSIGKNEELNLYNSKGEKDGFWYHPAKHIGIGTKGNYLNGKKEGVWISYKFVNEEYRVLDIEEYKKGLLHNKGIYLSSSGNVKLTLEYSLGKIDGEANFFSDNGNLLATFHYKENRVKEILYYRENHESPPKNEFDFNPLSFVD